MFSKNNFFGVSKGKKKRILVAALFLLVSLMSLIAWVTLAINYTQQKKKLLLTMQESTQQKVLATSEAMSTFIKLLKISCTELADKLEDSNASKKEIEAYLFEKHCQIAELSIKFKPEFSPTGKFWNPSVLEIDGKDALKDFSDSPINWDNEIALHDTFSMDVDANILVEYRHVFYHTNAKTGERVPAGIIVANQTHQHFRHILSTLFYGKAGYWFIVEKSTGTILIHPKKQYEEERDTLLQLSEKRNNAGLKELYDRIQNEKTGYLTYKNEVRGITSLSLLYFISIPATNFILCGVFDQEDLIVTPTQERRDIIKLFLYFILFVFFLISAFLLVGKGDIKKLWLLSFLFSCGCLILISVAWYTVIRYPFIQETGKLIRDKIDLYKKVEDIKSKLNQTDLPKESSHYLNDNPDTSAPKDTLSEDLLKYLTFHYHSSNSNGKYNVDPKYDYLIIPTGIFINHMNYINQNQLEVGFFLWQRYIKAIHGTIKHDILFPKAVQVETKVLYTREIDGVEIILWEVKCVLDQLADFSLYPFDVNAIRLKIWPNEFDQKIVLVPDFNAYNSVNPRFLPGLASKNFLVGFNPMKSFFSYREGAYNTNFGIYFYGMFGIYDQLDKAKVPELYFNIIPQRKMLDIFIADLTPLIIIALLIFYLFMTLEIHSHAMFRSNATIFFGLLLAHLRFRSKVPTPQFVYFDCLYIVLYIMILLLTIFSLFNVLHFKGDLPEKNLLAKVLYWPFIFGSILLITLFYFY